MQKEYFHVFSECSFDQLGHDNNENNDPIKGKTKEEMLDHLTGKCFYNQNSERIDEKTRDKILIFADWKCPTAFRSEGRDPYVYQYVIRYDAITGLAKSVKDFIEPDEGEKSYTPEHGRLISTTIQQAVDGLFLDQWKVISELTLQSQCCTVILFKCYKSVLDFAKEDSALHQMGREWLSTNFFRK